MRLQSIYILLVLLLATAGVWGQSKTTDQLQSELSDRRVFFLYHNTLRMINQQEDPEFDAIIKDIEKMKLLLVRKEKEAINYNSIRARYEKDAFEPIMTSRFQGSNFDMFVKEKDGKTIGMLVLVNSEESLLILDIVGHIALDQVTKLYSVINDSSDMGGIMERFIEGEKRPRQDSVKTEPQ
jgi:hypothetical protein